jgi:hypothetical protein
LSFTSIQPFHASSKKEDSDSAAAPSQQAAPAKKGWWDPIYAIPLGITLAVPAIKYEWYIINEETLVSTTRDK